MAEVTGLSAGAYATRSAVQSPSARSAERAEETSRQRSETRTETVDRQNDVKARRAQAQEKDAERAESARELRTAPDGLGRRVDISV
ncbi:hypothetical protein [Polymorphum gilvum]|uniref:Uncharacterized protein n=1 Tax=Polymorphum gilvum (strain LMG 25793 / CGMCC 1.9160 / SL003B-26A1) TaxID=991905 RepID=F2IZD7_POLGS|nr:hypothetical protein [Polymorphum gilvum]ADZ68560.1 hypothetical protein SL003B_0121 [Polymorphum gilvum SL003B-26A1]